jgi:hypothetical protein
MGQYSQNYKQIEIIHESPGREAPAAAHHRSAQLGMIILASC